MESGEGCFVFTTVQLPVWVMFAVEGQMPYSGNVRNEEQVACLLINRSKSPGKLITRWSYILISQKKAFEPSYDLT